MTMQEAIQKREELLAEERKLNQAIKILNSESIPKCAGIIMAIGQYKRRISEITEEIKECANSVTSEAETITQQMDLQDLLVELLKRYMNK
ncbi:MAG: hypothetical protein HUJ61_06090 [Bacilli bacterium]|nr:hypothetical protein [Bacilli bacterium]